MASNRYGQIWHGNHHHINIRFPSTEARLKFQDEFEEYHNSHDHDGDIPTFKCVTLKDLKLSTGSRSPQDLVKAETDEAYRITIDGYSWSEIHEYHNEKAWREYTWYSVPTCCIPPTIVIDHKFVDSGTLQRHPLSAIFGDMPEADYKSLLESVQCNGFIEPIIRVYEGQILDGWHRYRAAEELNLIRKLKFQEWNKDEHRDGDPKAFVLARNIERRHLNASQRAQIAVAFNERFGHGGDRTESKSPNGDLKTRQELAAEANVGTSTIDRAVQVEKTGQSEAVISGEKTASEVLAEREAKKLLKQKKQKAKLMWDTRIQAARDYIDDGDTDLNLHLTLPELEKGFAENNPSYALDFNLAMSCTSETSFKIMWDKIAESNLTVEVLENRFRALQTYAGDIRQWERPDWSPDTNWILPLIEAKKKKAKAEVSGDLQVALDEMKSEAVEPEDAIEAALVAWKEKRAHLPHLAAATKAMAIKAAKRWHNLEKDADIDENKVLGLLSSDAQTFQKSIEGYIARADKPKPEPDLKELRKQVKAQMLKYKQWYKDSGYQESELVSRASFSQLIHVLRESRETEQGGAATVAELKDLLDILKRKSYPFAHKLRQIVRPEQPDPAEADDEPDDRSVNDRMDRCRADLLDVWQQTYDWEGLEIQLYVDEYGLGADVIAVMQKEIATEHPKPEPCEPETEDEDTSLTEIDNLPAVKHFLESLLKQTETFVHPHDKDDFSVSVFDALMVDSDLTKRQQLSILIDCAHSIVMESESTSF